MPARTEGERRPVTDRRPQRTRIPLLWRWFGAGAVLHELGEIKHLIEQGQETLMARLDPITTALGNISTQLTQLSTQIAELQAGSVTQEEIDAVAAQAQSIADAADAAIEPDAGEGAPPVEPPVEPPFNPNP